MDDDAKRKVCQRENPRNSAEACDRCRYVCATCGDCRLWCGHEADA